MYEVCIYTKDITYNPNYDGYAISLPASKAEIEDALQRTRVSVSYTHLTLPTIRLV